MLKGNPRRILFPFPASFLAAHSPAEPAAAARSSLLLLTSQGHCEAELDAPGKQGAAGSETSWDQTVLGDSWRKL